MSSPISTNTNTAYTDQSTNPMFKITVRDLTNPLEQKRKSTHRPNDVSLKNKDNKFKVGDFVTAEKNGKTYEGSISKISDDIITIMLKKTKKTIDVEIESCKKTSSPQPVDEPVQDGTDYVPESKTFLTFKEFCLHKFGN